MEHAPRVCSCTPLAEPLVDETIDDFDHICRETMMANIRAAIRDDLLQPAAEWPIAMDGRRRLGFVLREWVQTEPDRALASLLATNSRWRIAVRSLRDVYDVWRERNPDHDLRSWIVGPPNERISSRRLREAGLPYSPATTRHLRAVAAELSLRRTIDERFQLSKDGLLELSAEQWEFLSLAQESWLPARGLLIKTSVFVRTTPAHTVLLDSKGPDVEIGGPLEFTTGPLLNRAQKAILQHRDWLRRFTQHPLTRIRAIRRAQPHSWSRQKRDTSEDRFDYLQEALDGLEALRLTAPRHPIGIQGAISDHLKTVYNRVAARRRENGLSTKPPSGWTTKARQQLLMLLK